jgi:hypothetical protein
MDCGDFTLSENFGGKPSFSAPGSNQKNIWSGLARLLVVDGAHTARQFSSGDRAAPGFLGQRHKKPGGCFGSRPVAFLRITFESLCEQGLHLCLRNLEEEAGIPAIVDTETVVVLDQVKVVPGLFDGVGHRRLFGRGGSCIR